MPTAGRCNPGTRPQSTTAATSTAPEFPAEKKADASPESTDFIAHINDEFFFERIAFTGSSAIPISCSVNSNVIESDSQ